MTKKGRRIWGRETFKMACGRFEFDTLLTILLFGVFGNLACFNAYFVTATFDDDLKSYIQKSIADSLTLTTQRISFSHPPPSSNIQASVHVSGVNKVEPLAQQFDLYFFPDILFWDNSVIERSPTMPQRSM